MKGIDKLNVNNSTRESNAMSTYRAQIISQAKTYKKSRLKFDGENLYGVHVRLEHNQWVTVVVTVKEVAEAFVSLAIGKTIKTLDTMRRRYTNKEIQFLALLLPTIKPEESESLVYLGASHRKSTQYKQYYGAGVKPTSIIFDDILA